ncbi:hypothetical protein PGTUg99_028587 [Puccinia graminis f. sp. tritici]|uniref:PSP1 C-terminal domain-containing protein n=1 Tax=Puccinia graminis f. sp. tritici TaxID=56615 RepID=A0A5B0MDF2_PUCGR|nr:hypothetical protein PGTUg99_028587 [Puccinia graminis f. sp. tritici]
MQQPSTNNHHQTNNLPNQSQAQPISSIDLHQNNLKPHRPNDQMFVSLDRPPLNLHQSAGPFSSPLSSPLPDLRTTDHDPPSTFSPRGSISLDPTHHPNLNLRSFNNNNNNNRQTTTNNNPPALQSASLPFPKRTHPVTNIWAQAIDTPTSTSSCSGSDFELNSPLLTHPSMINRRFSHLSTTQPHHPQSPIGSPASIADPIGPISLSTDRYRGSLTPTSPLSTSFGPNSLPSNFYQPWYDSSLSADGLLAQDERIGRSKARDILGTRQAGSYRDPSVGSIGSPCSSSARSGIGLSNMSPFTGTSLLPPGGPVSFGGSLTTHNLDLGYRTNRARDSSLGAIGSGRMTSRSSVPSASSGPSGSGLGLASSGSRMLNKGSDFGFVGSVGTDSWLTGGRSLSNDLDEDDEFAPPTKSGATSRRHSVSAFIGGRSSVQGFEPVSTRTHNNTSSLLNDKKNHRVPMESVHSSSGIPLGSIDNPNKNDHQPQYEIFGPSSTALTDEDLCFTADFNSLNLDLETQTSREPSDRLSFQFSNHYQNNNHQSAQQSPFQPKPNHPAENNHDRSAIPPLNNMPWSAVSPATTTTQGPAPGSNVNPFGGPGNFARKSSFSAGDPFSASAQASRYFASQAGNSMGTVQDAQPPPGSRFPFSHSGSALQPLGSLSSPAVTTFSASGLLSAPSPHSRQIINGDSNSKQAGPLGYAFDPSSGPSYYSASAASHPHMCSSPLSPMFQIQSGISGPSPQSLNSQFNNQMISSPRSSTTPGPGPNELSELGKGVPLHQIPRDCRLYIVEFKGGRTDLFYLSLDPSEAVESVQKGDLVIVEADRGKDLGKVVHDQISIDEVNKFQNHQLELMLNQVNNPAASSPVAIHSAIPTNGLSGSIAPGPPPPANGDLNPQAQPNPANLTRLTKEIHPKRIYGKASASDVQSLHQKMEEERKALSLCRSKALQRGLKMEITSAEWQWDRRKLTFFFIADKRIDFRDLVKDLFRTWKTRIWMCSVNP